MKEKEPLVSIIIPTYNCGNTIGICLESIKNQTYKEIEIIIVDGYSKDNTLQISQSYDTKIFVKNAGMSEATNFGIEMSKGKYIYRVDSDIIMDKNIVEECIRKCELEDYDGIAIFWTPDPTISFWAKVRKLEKDCYKDSLFPRGARFINKNVINSIGGFNSKLVAGEDYDVYNRLIKNSYKIGQINYHELHIGEPVSIKEIITKNYYYGKTIKRFLNNNVSGLKQISPVRIILLKNWKKFLRYPILTIGFIIYEITVYSSSIAGFLISIFEKDIK